MKREIKFRGMRVNTKEWVDGYYWMANGKTFMLNMVYKDFSIINVIIEVIPETVGQYTGLKDVDGEEIYAGDILKEERRGLFYKVFSVPGGFAVNTHQNDFDKEQVIFHQSISDMQMTGYISGTCSVIGNIHQHPELLHEIPH